MARPRIASLFGSLPLWLLGTAFLARFIPASPGDIDLSSHLNGPKAGFRSSAGSDSILVTSSTGDAVLLSLDCSTGSAMQLPSGVRVGSWLGTEAVEQRLATATAMRWNRPRPGLPAASVFVAQGLDHGSRGEATMLTLLRFNHELPVVSLVAADKDLFGAEDGLLVVGNTMLTAPADLSGAYARDPKPWKYPGNFHRRGRAWERPALIALLDRNGSERWQQHVAIRVNGQQTRGLAQHSLRVMFHQPMRDTLFGEGSQGFEALVIRSSGNDQVKAMIRDAFQHELCAGLGFDVSAAMPVVLYVNGAYWGVHYLRQRLDHKEIGRRLGIHPKRITIIEDRGALYRGKEQGRREFLAFVDSLRYWNHASAGWAERVSRHIDVDEFLAYMATQMILGNMDWPKQNVKFWRVEGGEQGNGRADGRWHMAMGDSDLGLGAIAGPEADMFIRVKSGDTPTSRLFLALMRSPEMRDRFNRKSLELLDGVLGAARASDGLDDFVGRVRSEMGRHTNRWRKPADVEDWRHEVDVVRRFLTAREAHVRTQLASYMIKKGA